MDTTSTSKPDWYDPTAWPTWLRWAALGPVPLAAAIVVYFVYVIVNGIANSFMPMMPSAVVSLIAGAVGAYMYVLIGRIIAPAFKSLAGFTLASLVFLCGAYMAGMMFSNGTHSSSMPEWYIAVFLAVAVIGAIVGAFAELPEMGTLSHSGEVFAWMPTILRWILFFPLGIIASLIVGFVFVLMFWLLHAPGELTQLINTLLEAVTFIGVASALAPRGKKIIGISIASIMGVFAAAQVIFGIDRPLAAQLLAHLSHGDVRNVGFFMSQWYQMLSGIGLLFGALIGATGAVEADRARKTLT